MLLLAVFSASLSFLATQDILRSLLATVFYYVVLPIIFIASLLAFIPRKRFAN